ncbi:MAG: protein kinase [Gemmatimonas sp.]
MTTPQADRLSAALADRYRIERELGAGGMATVYLSEDLKHDRKVAIKVLKPELAAVLGAERFVVEIKTTAAMSHPHILPLFDSGTADGFLFYVMPYIQGETIREKLNRETQFGVDEAVRIAREIADALDYAHRNGVIHRDIKPENILLHDGRAMVMDFGIALAVSAAAGGRMTETGLSLGTPHYMSPEQATAEKEITGRSDQYSLASVLYEMLAGDPPFVASAAQAVIMKIITEPAASVTTRRKNVPANVDAALARALEKLPADRFESAKAFADALGNPGFANTTAASGGLRGSSRRGVSPALFWATAAVAVAAIGVAAAQWRGRSSDQPRAISRFLITPEGEASVTAISADRELAISPDGSHIAYVGNDGTRLYVRSMDALESVPLGRPGVVPRGPFFSPDGAWVGFFAEGQLQKVAVTGGPVIPIARTSGGLRRGATWGADSTIVYATDVDTSGLWRVSADGQTTMLLTTPDSARGELDHVFPSYLPGGRALLFTILPRSGGIEGASVAVYDLETKTYKVVVRGGSDARYVPSGHLVFGSAGALRAVRFDLKRLEASGTPTTVVESVAIRSQGAAQFDLTSTGTLLYVPEGTDPQKDAPRTLAWVDRQGRETPIKAPARAYRSVRISPDGKQAAAEISDQDWDIWLWNFTTEALTRLTFNPRGDYSPVWMPEGRRLAIASGSRGVLLMTADGTGTPEVVSPLSYTPTSTSPSGDRIVIRTTVNGSAVQALTTGKSPTAASENLVVGDGLWGNGEVSPDGRWLAYDGGVAGQPQIYVRPYPNVASGRWQLTTEGGSRPVWARNGRELFFVGANGAIMSIAVGTGSAWSASSATKVADVPLYAAGLARSYDVAPDGKRFLIIKRAATDVQTNANLARSAEPGMVVVQNWVEELRRLVPKP